MVISRLRASEIKHRRSLAAFFAVGIATAAVNFSVFTLLWEYGNTERTLAVSSAYGIAVLFHFYMNRRFTFRGQDGNLGSHAIRYAVMVAVNYGVTLAVVAFSVSVLMLSPYAGIVLSTVATFLIGYAVSRFWVFRS